MIVVRLKHVVYQVSRFFACWFERRISMGFTLYSHMGTAAILVIDKDQSSKPLFLLHIPIRPYWNLPQ